jgi:hypothetical protein
MCVDSDLCRLCSRCHVPLRAVVLVDAAGREGECALGRFERERPRASRAADDGR